MKFILQKDPPTSLQGSVFVLLSSCSSFHFTLTSLFFLLFQLKMMGERRRVRGVGRGRGNASIDKRMSGEGVRAGKRARAKADFFATSDVELGVVPGEDVLVLEKVTLFITSLSLSLSVPSSLSQSLSLPISLFLSISLTLLFPQNIFISKQNNFSHSFPFLHCLILSLSFSSPQDGFGWVRAQSYNSHQIGWVHETVLTHMEEAHTHNGEGTLSHNGEGGHTHSKERGLTPQGEEKGSLGGVERESEHTTEAGMASAHLPPPALSPSRSLSPAPSPSSLLASPLSPPPSPSLSSTFTLSSPHENKNEYRNGSMKRDAFGIASEGGEGGGGGGGGEGRSKK